MTDHALRNRFLLNGLPLALALLLALASGCGSPPSQASAQTADRGCITGFDPDKDYFPDKSSFQDATNVSVEYHKSYKVVTVNQPAPGKPAQRYLLVQCGAPQPRIEAGTVPTTRVSIPVRRVAASSTTQLPAYELLDEVGALAGAGAAGRAAEGKVKDAVDAGRIKDFGTDAGGIDVEQVAGLAPDLYVASGPDDAAGAKLAELRIPVVANAEWLENTALGRAEWMKYTALFLNAEKKADETYRKIRADYRAVADKAASVGTRPTVLLGSPTRGTWYATATDSYFANEIRDAGGQYVLHDIAGTASRPLDLEVVLAKGAQAQFWLGAARTTAWKSLAEPLKDDPRLGNLTAVQQGNVWTYTRRITPGGGNDYWQSGVVRPDLVLADLVAILHPELMPGHRFTYYEQVPRP